MKLLGMTAALVAAGLLASAESRAAADNLFKGSQWVSMASDQKAAEVGDVLTVIVYQTAEARNAAENASRRRRSIEGNITTDVANQEGEVALSGSYSGRGEVKRSESFVTQISVTVREVMPNGDLLVAGEQLMKVNGEKSKIIVRGRVRPYDITADNRILSTRLADAEISYNGQGFVSRNSRSGPFDWLLSVLGFSG